MPLGLAKTWSVERLRRVLIAMAVLLLLALLGFVLYSQWRLRRVAQDLPARLGISIQQTTQGYVLSKTERGRNVFTLHAARAVEFKSGKRVSLHNVEIDIYNPRGGPADVISGSDFEFDPHTQVVQSQGETHIVLYPPKNGSGARLASGGSAQPIRVTTHGLVFSQKTGIATCSGEVDFQIAGSTGQAVGAEYDSKRGRLLLRSKVLLTTSMHDRPAELRAVQAVYDKDASQVHLLQPRYASALPNGTERGAAREAVVTLRRNGSAKGLDAQGNVRLTSADGATVQSGEMNAALGSEGQPQQVHFSGGVQFRQKNSFQDTTGSSQQAEVNFNAQGRAEQAMFDDAVQFHQRTEQNGSRRARTLRCSHLDLHLLPAGKGQAQLQSAEANGDAVFTSQSTAQRHAPVENTLAAQALKAQFVAGNKIRHIDGAGQTRIRTVAANGDVDTSTGNTLQVDFSIAPSAATEKKPAHSGLSRPSSAALGAGTMPAQESIQRAVQTGHVELQQTSTRKSGASSEASVSTANAARAEYLAPTDTMTLTGNPEFRTRQLEIGAERIAIHRSTGDAVFSGTVQSTLRHSGHSPGGGLLDGGNQPVHIIAENATLLHAQQQAVFAGRARLWQGDDAIAAPVIQLSKKMQTLAAYSTTPCTQCVIGSFMARPAASGGTGFAHEAKKGGPSTFRILSGKLFYSEAERKITVQNDVQVIGASGDLFSDKAEIFLAQARNAVSPSVPSRGQAATQSSLEKIVATGHVRLMQPGRRATGTRLVYTANDGRFVLTGDAANPPQAVDADRGTVTGQELTFSSPDQAIMVTGTSNRATTGTTRVKKK